MQYTTEDSGLVTWCCVTRQGAPTVSKDCSAFPPLNKGNGTTIPQTVGKRSPKYTPTHLRIIESCEDVKSCTDMRHSQHSAVMWPVTPSVCASLRNAAIHPKLPQSLNVLVLIHTEYLPELCIQHKRHKHKVHIFLVSVTGMLCKLT